MLNRVLTLAAVVLVVKVTVAVVLGYVDYAPPNFGSDFLRGRSGYFFGPYRWAFYTHILSGPFSLVAGLVLLSESFRRRWPRGHRILGRVQVANVLLLVTPSGLWMARYAAAGPVAGASLATLALVTALCITFGWRAAVRRRFDVHRNWMWRTFLLLCSAVVLRIFGGFAAVTGIDAAWYDPAASWAGWLLPLAAFELGRFRRSMAKVGPAVPVSTSQRERVAL